MSSLVLVYYPPKGGKEQRYHLKPGMRYRIGSAKDNDIVVEAQDVSRHHAVLSVGENGELKVTDLGSTNGTFVNNHRVVTHILKPGDRLNLSSAEFAVELGEDSVPAPPPPEDSSYTERQIGIGGMMKLVELMEEAANLSGSASDLSKLLAAIVKAGKLKGSLVVSYSPDRKAALEGYAGEVSDLTEMLKRDDVKDYVCSESKSELVLVLDDSAFAAKLERCRAVLLKATSTISPVDVKAIKALVKLASAVRRRHEDDISLEQLSRVSLSEALATVQKKLVDRALEANAGDLKAAASALGITVDEIKKIKQS